MGSRTVVKTKEPTLRLRLQEEEETSISVDKNHFETLMNYLNQAGIYIVGLQNTVNKMGSDVDKYDELIKILKEKYNISGNTIEEILNKLASLSKPEVVKISDNVYKNLKLSEKTKKWMKRYDEL